MSGQIVKQFTAVSIDGRAVLIEGPTGCGKTSLALALIDRGAVLIGDDGVKLTKEAQKLIASPPPNIAGLIEIRGIGIGTFPVTRAPVSLVLVVSSDTPRFVETVAMREILDCEIPCLPFALTGLVDAIRAEYALRFHGLA